MTPPTVTGWFGVAPAIWSAQVSPTCKLLLPREVVKLSVPPFGVLIVGELTLKAKEPDCIPPTNQVSCQLPTSPEPGEPDKEKLPALSVVPSATLANGTPCMTPPTVTGWFGVAPAIWSFQVSPTCKLLLPLEVVKLSLPPFPGPGAPPLEPLPPLDEPPLPYPYWAMHAATLAGAVPFCAWPLGSQRQVSSAS